MSGRGPVASVNRPHMQSNVSRMVGAHPSLNRSAAAGDTPLRPLATWSAPVLYFRSTDSTSTRARDLARAGAPHRTLVLADEQTAGRGRQGRAWATPPFKALALSVVLRELGPNLGLLPFAAALATCVACESVAGVRCSIKWPNDVWIDRQKLAGILIETRPREQWAVLGIGVNVNLERDDFPQELRSTATSLTLAKNRQVDRQTLLEDLLRRLDEWLQRLVSGQRGAILAAFRKRDALAGNRITWAADSEMRSGEAAGIDDEGNLLVVIDSETRTIRAGEVHLERD